MTALAFVDTETTGVHPGRRAWEVAIIRRESDGSESTLHAFVGDVDLSEADPFGLRIGHFYDRHPRFARDLDVNAMLIEQQVASRVERFTRGAHLVGAVPNFDAEVFDSMLRRHRLIPAWHYHLIDVEALAVGYLHGRKHDDDLADRPWHNAVADVGLPWKSDDLSRACGVEPAIGDERHTALGDAKWAMRLYDAITGGSS